MRSTDCIIPLCDLRLKNSTNYKLFKKMAHVTQSKHTPLSSQLPFNKVDVLGGNISLIKVKKNEEEEEEDNSWEEEKRKTPEKIIVKILDSNSKKVKKSGKKRIAKFTDSESEDEDYEPSSPEEEDYECSSSEVENEENSTPEKVKKSGKKRIAKFTDSESEDEDYKPSSSETRKSKIKSKRKENAVCNTKLSAYELLAEKNKAERMALLQSLKIEEAKAGFYDDVQKKTSKPVKRVYKRIENKTSPPVLRKSRRLAKIDFNLSEEALFANALKAAEEEEVAKKMIIPPEFSFQKALSSEKFYESYVTDINIQELKPEKKFFSYDNFLYYFRGFTDFLSMKLYTINRNSVPKDDNGIQTHTDFHSKFITYDKSVLSKMTVKDSNIAKVIPDRITALTWYPSPDQLIVTAGSKRGDLGIWNVDSESNPYVLKIHSEGITNLQFNPFNPVLLISSSYDGILRCGDMVKHNFYELYNVSEETSCTYFDFLSATTYLVAQRNGQVALVDKRSPGKSHEKRHDCHENSLKTVSVHPVNKNFFVTAENKGSIRLWDLRKLQKDPVTDVTHHKRCVHSAFFSPITGNSILATSTDDSVSIFDCTNLKDVTLQKQMRHNNNTGRWLSFFRAMWLPNSEESFVIGSMDFQRKIQIFDKNMFVYHHMMHENLTTISSTNAFHPTRPALAGGNSSGKVFVFL